MSDNGANNSRALSPAETVAVVLLLIIGELLILMTVPSLPGTL